MIFYDGTLNDPDNDNPWKQNAGHATIMGSKPTVNEDGQLSFTEYSITAEGQKYGERTVTFTKDDEGNWISDQSGYQIQGFGRVDEEAIVNESEQE